jgi:hypothetical protein
MSEYARAGLAVEGDLGIHFSPAWTFYGFWEYGMLGRGSANINAPDSSAMNTVGIGFNANSTPRGPVGFYFDVAAGYRWFNFSSPDINVDQFGNVTSNYNRIIAEGWMPLRIALGMSIVLTEKMRVDLSGNLAVGTFSKMKGGNACSAGCTIEPENRGTHITTGLTAGVRWDL